MLFDYKLSCYMYFQTPPLMDQCLSLGSLPGVCVPSDCTTWRSLVEKDLLSLDKALHNSLLHLFDVYLAGVLMLFSELSQSCSDSGGTEGAAVHQTTKLSSATESELPNQLQLVRSMCRILKVHVLYM